METAEEGEITGCSLALVHGDGGVGRLVDQNLAAWKDSARKGMMGWCGWVTVGSSGTYNVSDSIEMTGGLAEGLRLCARDASAE